VTLGKAAGGAVAVKTAGGTVATKATGGTVAVKTAGGTVAAKTAVTGAVGAGTAAGIVSGVLLQSSGFTLAVALFGGLGPAILVGYAAYNISKEAQWKDCTYRLSHQFLD